MGKEMFTFILGFHFPGDTEQATVFDENEQYQEIAEYNIGIRKGLTFFLEFSR